ncbi:gentisate 1,2-dioxygenase [Variovorax sp. EBFNA2]|uniref:gentisate 1,2-dioxygenase n=1 Tax=Variovorax sp. EBFNA2 TaxID=3342097 RepID=UPI0029C04016|nr:gentisate 1,2-dioxygenase [Variovorax boronicumulans]WPG41525.1 gentisate 1,2-dioxygenase [Variovorax boronicumulans]
MTSSSQLSERESYYSELGNHSLAPLWASLARLVPPSPQPSAQAFAWKYAEIRQHLLTAGNLITAEEAERRVLVLENPSLSGQSRITDTLYAGLQLILPGEVAPAHRHVQSALRFAIEGEGAYTAVNGERVSMSPGDFIITPAWTWHDHGSESSGPVVWLDGLDVPFIDFLKAGFREQYEHASQIAHRSEGEARLRFGSGMLRPSDKPTNSSPLFKYPYDQTKAALALISKTEEIDAHRGFEIRYINPTTGGDALPTISAGMRLLPDGFKTSPYRSTDGSVIVLVEGSLRATVADKEITLSPKDVLAIPAWASVTLEASGETVLFNFSDAPVHQKLGLWREERS